jgi:hypothetical protein
MCKHTWLASLFTLIVVGSLLDVPLGAAAQTPAPGPTLARGGEMNALWVVSPSDIFAVGWQPGGSGAILHYDGHAWSPMSAGTPHWLSWAWGSSHSDVFASGEGGAILHYDGSAWSTMKSGTDNSLVTIRGTSGSDIFAVGRNATILHCDGKAWSVMNDKWPVQPAPTHSFREGMDFDPCLECVWANSPSDVFAVGDYGVILHYDGKAWSPMVSGVNVDLGDVWGTSGSDVFVSGWQGTILHYDGKSWSPMSSGTSKTIYSLWRTPEGDFFAAGEGGTILHYDGKAWSVMASGTSTDLWGPWGTNNDLYAIGKGPNVILHYDGKAWSITNAPY